MPEEAQKRIDEITDVLGLADELGRSIARINELFSFKRRINVITKLISAAVVVDIIITVTFFIFFHALHNAQQANCRNSNEARASQVSIWTGIIDKFGPAHPTAVQVAKDKRFLVFIRDRLHLVDCSKL